MFIKIESLFKLIKYGIPPKVINYHGLFYNYDEDLEEYIYNSDKETKYLFADLFTSGRTTTILNTIIIVEENEYIEKMLEVLNDNK